MRDALAQKALFFLPAVVSGMLLVLAFPRFDLFFFAWVAFIPLLLALWKKEGSDAFALGYAFGLVFFFGTLYWVYHSINHFGGVSFPVSICIVLLLCAYLSLYPAVFAWVFALLINRTKLPAVVIAPVFWVVLEFVRSYAFSGFPWASLGYSQYRFLPAIQAADITGIYGISFLVLAVNSTVADIVILRRRLREMPLFPVSVTAVGMGMVIVMTLAALGYGFWRLGQERRGTVFQASVIQGNIEQDHKWDPAYQNDVMAAYTDLSKAAAAGGTQLVVWPETAAPFAFNQDAGRAGSLVRLGQDLGAYLLFGSILVREQSAQQRTLTNSALLLDREGKTIYIYDKIHLVPFGEYVPLRSILFFLDKIVAGIGDYAPGQSYVKGGTDFGSFATLICYEIIFPGMVRKFYTKGGDFMVTITNDAWFGKTAGPYQHFSMAVFRAIENRKPVIRAANTGISGFIDSSGRIRSTTRLFERTVLTERVQTDGTLTLYTKYGDLFSFFCIVVAIVLLINIRFWR